jgi:uncharacterized protein
MRQTFVNLPVEDVATARAFWTAMGFRIDERYSGDDSVAVELAEGASYAMLLRRGFFETFLAGTAVADPTATTQVLVCLSCEERDDVDATVERAVAAGGKPHKPSFDMGEVMRGGSFRDPDGHVWELAWMSTDPC